MGVVRACLRLAVGLVDEVILAHSICSRSDNAWEAADAGLLPYAQNGTAMVGAATWLTFITWVLSALVFLLMLGLAAALAWLFLGDGATRAFSSLPCFSSGR